MFFIELFFELFINSINFLYKGKAFGLFNFESIMDSKDTTPSLFLYSTTLKSSILKSKQKSWKLHFCLLFQWDIKKIKINHIKYVRDHPINHANIYHWHALYKKKIHNKNKQYFFLQIIKKFYGNLNQVSRLE